MHILITGGCGFIGSNLARYHLAKGDTVHVIDNLSTGRLQNIEEWIDDPKFIFDEADIEDWPHLKDAIKSAERIYHTAAVVGMFNVIAHPRRVIETNIVGCEYLLKTIAETNLKPLVFILSSSSVYGNSSKDLLSETDDLIIKPVSHPLSTYAASKLANEVTALAYYRSINLPVIVPRLLNTIGLHQSGQYGMVVPRFIHAAIEDKPLTIFGDGNQTRSFCDVRDVIRALDLLADCREALGEVINVGNDHDISINDLTKLVGKCVGKEVKTEHISYRDAYGVDYTDITQRRPDLKKLMSLIHFKHEWTLEQSIRDQISAVNLTLTELR